MLLSWAFWKLANGKQQNVALIGVGERLAGAPWAMQEGQIDCLRRPNRVIVDDLFRDKLGITGVDDDAEVLQKNVIVGGLSRDVRTLTAAPHVFMALESLRECDPRLRTDDITYVLVRCVSPLSIQTVKECITAEVPGVEVLTSREFGVRTSRFWLLETGLGFTVALTAALGVLVGCVVSSQTLYAVTHDHLRDYATLLAVGFTRASVLQIVLVQAMLLGATGICVGTILFWWAVKATASTPVPIETTGPVYMSVTAACFGSAALAAWVSVRTIHRIDPISVFQ
ncbi:MAG: FtsX-like permease family protein [Pirellulales bacterium]|nr:FtsX-like permease family protein [Pirellulales bacterium]